ncbi:MAG: DUF2149 domain-containing protein [Halobacteriota archaeon]|nr:DUF2149 domain-containing protein [Halobacteriota archaeon]
MKYMRRERKKRYYEDEDPMSSVANLFDVAMVFSVALLVALVMSFGLTELLDPSSDLTVVKNPGQPDMQIIVKQGEKIETLNSTDEEYEVEITKTIGTIYQTKDGGMMYVPENMSSN